MKEQLCEAFCAQIDVRRVPSGFAITTPYRFSDGDPIIVYAIKAKDGHFRLEDAGVQIPMLEASGVNLQDGTRGDGFRELLTEYNLTFDSDAAVVHTEDIAEPEIGSAVLRLMAFMLRLQDFMLLTPERVGKTWREDAMKKIHIRFDPVASVEERSPPLPALPGLPADAVIRFRSGGPPLAVFFATTDAKALQALVLKMELEKYQDERCIVILMVERAKDNPLREATYALSQARLDDVLTFRGAEAEAMQAISRYQAGPATIQ